MFWQYIEPDISVLPSSQGRYTKPSLHSSGIFYNLLVTLLVASLLVARLPKPWNNVILWTEAYTTTINLYTFVYNW